MSLDVRLCETRDEFAALRGEWTALLRGAQARSLFLTWEWLNACSLTVARGDRLAIVCVYDGGDLVAAAPLVRRRARYYRVPVFETAFLGDPLSDRQFFLDGSPDAVGTKLIWHYLAQDPFRTSILRLEQVPQESPTLCEARRLSLGVEIESGACLPFVPLAASWVEFQNRLDSRFRYDMRTRPKVFDAFGSWEVRHATGTAVLPYLDEMARVELASGKGKQGHAFFQHPMNAACLKTFLENTSGTEVVPVLSTLRIAGSIAAYVLGFFYDAKYHAYNTAYLPEYRKGSPGKFVVHEAIRYSHELGATEFDLLRGDFFMKREWKPSVRQNARCVLHSRTPIGQLLKWSVFRARPQLKRWFGRV